MIGAGGWMPACRRRTAGRAPQGSSVGQFRLSQASRAAWQPPTRRRQQAAEVRPASAARRSSSAQPAPSSRSTSTQPAPSSRSTSAQPAPTVDEASHKRSPLPGGPSAGSGGCLSRSRQAAQAGIQAPDMQRRPAIRLPTRPRRQAVTVCRDSRGRRSRCVQGTASTKNLREDVHRGLVSIPGRCNYPGRHLITAR